MSSHSPVHAVLCVANEGNEVSLQRWKIYKPLRDVVAQEEGLIRVIDESGEDYLFPEENFVPIELPKGARKPFERAVRAQRRGTAAPARSLPARSAGVQAQRKSPKRRTAGRV